MDDWKPVRQYLLRGLARALVERVMADKQPPATCFGDLAEYERRHEERQATMRALLAGGHLLDHGNNGIFITEAGLRRLALLDRKPVLVR